MHTMTLRDYREALRLLSEADARIPEGTPLGPLGHAILEDVRAWIRASYTLTCLPNNHLG